MSNKQVMLDGVDVLKEKINMCFILLLNKLETSETIEQTIYEHLDVFVEEWNKQLKAKEQECEKLKEKVKKYGEINEQETKDYAELKAENEELKKIINEAKNSNLDFKSFLVGEAVQNEYEQQLDQLKAENETYKKMLEDEDVRLALNEIRTGERKLWFNKAERLKQALAEIKEIAEKEVKCAPDGETFARPEIKQILQKISEV